MRTVESLLMCSCKLAIDASLYALVCCISSLEILWTMKQLCRNGADVDKLSTPFSGYGWLCSIMDWDSGKSFAKMTVFRGCVLPLCSFVLFFFVWIHDDPCSCVMPKSDISNFRDLYWWNLCFHQRAMLATLLSWCNVYWRLVRSLFLPFLQFFVGLRLFSSNIF